MPDTRLSQAVAHHQAGRLADADRLYRALLKDDPKNVDALNLRGVLALQKGDANQAVDLIGAAISLRDDVADFHNNIGEAYRARGDVDAAIEHYQRAVNLDPRSADAHNNLGVALKATGSMEAAEAHFQRAIEANPNHSRAHNNLGTAMRSGGRAEAAVQHLVRAIELDPNYADAHSNLGNVLADLDRAAQARTLYERALELNPDHGEALMNLGTLLKREGDWAASTAIYREAVSRRPDHADAQFNLGINLAEAGDLEAARAAYDAAITNAPNHVGAQANRARLLLLMGRFAEGFDQWEWRWREPATWLRTLEHPHWAGEPLAGKTLLIWGEQGVGDEIMLVSVLPEVIQAASRVIVECDARLIPIYRRSFPSAAFVARDEPPSHRLLDADIDYQCALGSLCRWLRRNAEDFAGPTPYLTADASKTAAIRARYQALGPEPKVGIAWRSKPKGAAIENILFSESKTIALESWEPILRAPGVRFVNLQYGDCANDLAAVSDRFGVEVFQDTEIDQMTSLDDFAAQIAALDLVVSGSNTTVHMAGALGREVWTMVPFVPDWRWQMARTDSLWYPNLRLFRQPAPNDWQSVTKNVAGELSHAFSKPEPVL